MSYLSEQEIAEIKDNVRLLSIKDVDNVSHLFVYFLNQIFFAPCFSIIIVIFIPTNLNRILGNKKSTMTNIQNRLNFVKTLARNLRPLYHKENAR